MNGSMKRGIDAALTIKPDEKTGLRTWMRDLEQAGQLRRIGALVDWNEEIGALARINLSLGGPALLSLRKRGLGQASTLRARLQPS